MNKLIQMSLATLVGFLLCLTLTQVVFAKDINYRTYKYGTNQTSMADGYYARPAKVVAAGNRYLVTMTIRTKQGLSPWPVKVNTIDGSTPINVTKTRHGTDYDYNYSFYARSLAHKISSAISIDVPQVYKADHQISFMFDQNLPSLTHKVNKKTTTSMIPTKSATSQAPKSDSETDSPATQDLIAQAKKQANTVKKEQSNLAAQRLKQNEKNRMDNENNERMFYYVMLGGILCLIILGIACIFLVLSVKNSQNLKDKK